MRKLLVAALFFSISFIAQSQNLTVQGTAPNLYITHTVAPKENFYSISRLYNQPPKSIASFNKITMEKGLTIGQHIKIPLNAENFDSNGSGDGKEIPLTHIVSKSETLFRIGNDLHVTAASIRKWNNLSSDKIAAGTPLVVGYLKTTGEQSVSAIKSNTTPAANSESSQKSAVVTKPEQTTEPKKDEPFTSVSNSGKEKKENSTETKRADENADSMTEANKSSSDSGAAIPEKDTALAVIPDTPPTVSAKEEVVKQETSVSKNEENKKISEDHSSGNIVTGTFEEIYASQSSQKSENTKSGDAATFKSTSGWQDKKYYVLMNDVTPGTIIKISSGDNKVVYAKVLGSMPEMKENAGLLLRISNAAASYLGIIDPKFPVQISYYQ